MKKKGIEKIKYTLQLDEFGNKYQGSKHCIFLFEGSAMFRYLNSFNMCASVAVLSASSFVLYSILLSMLCLPWLQ